MLLKNVILLFSIILYYPGWSQNPVEKLPPPLEKTMKGMEEHDKEYIKQKGSAFFKRISEGQTPLFTLVTCSDSRVQSTVFEDHPEGEFFTIRNIGNQLTTSMGSVDYGISHLDTRILLIIGHSNCGAINAVRNHEQQLGPDIIKELSTIQINKKGSEIEDIKQNVNNQVNIALEKYAQKIRDQHLWVIGSIYDFANVMHQGAGDLIIININGETNVSKLKEIMSE